MRQRYPIKKLADGRAFLNLGCGARMNFTWNNVDFSYYAYLVHHLALACILKKVGILSQFRYQKLMGIDPSIIRFDLSKGIPFDDHSFDVVYNSHVLEHINRDDVNLFLKECYRVLKTNGIIRIVVPDLQSLLQNYNSSLSKLEANQGGALDEHLRSIDDLFDQMVRKKGAGTMQQRPVVRFMEHTLFGDATRIGESHCWVYDKFTLKALLSEVGFKAIQVETFCQSRIDGWNQFYLDNNPDGSPYKTKSLYMEGMR